jgi:hypothetical protein
MSYSAPIPEINDGVTIMNSLVRGVVTRFIHSVSQVLILKISAFFPQCIYAFKMNPKMKSDSFPTQFEWFL